MRQAANALLAAPISVAASFGALLRRSSHARVGVAFSLTILLGFGFFSAGRPVIIAATAPAPILPLAGAAFEAVVGTDHGLTEPVTIHFSTPMDAASVRSATSSSGTSNFGSWVRTQITVRESTGCAAR